MCQETRVSDQKKSRFLCRYADGEALGNIMNQLSDELNLNYLHLKQTTCLPAQFKRRQLTGTFLERFVDLYKACGRRRANPASRRSRDLTDHA